MQKALAIMATVAGALALLGLVLMYLKHKAART
jgi:hypothetical protein